MLLQMALFHSFLWPRSIPLCIYIHRIFFIYSSNHGYLCCFHVLAIVNKATVNIGVRVSVWIIVLSGYVCAQPCLTLCNPMDCSPPGSSVMEFSRQEYWSGLPFPSPGDLPNPEIKPRSPALQAGSLPSEPPEKLLCFLVLTYLCKFL